MNNKNKFIKGKSGNPDGRPDKTDTYKYLMEFYSQYTVAELKEIHKKKTTRIKDAIVIMQLIKASEGKIRNAELVIDRTEGKPKQSMELSGTENPLQVFVERHNKRVAERNKVNKQENNRNEVISD